MMEIDKKNDQAKNNTAEKPDWHPFSVWKQQILSRQATSESLEIKSQPATDITGTWKIQAELGQTDL